MNCYMALRTMNYFYNYNMTYTLMIIYNQIRSVVRIGQLIDWGLTPFLTISQLYHGGQFTYSSISWFSHSYITAASSPTHQFPGFLTPVLHTTIFPSNWLLFHIDLAHWCRIGHKVVIWENCQSPILTLTLRP